MPRPQTDPPALTAPPRKPGLIRALDRAIDLVFPPRCVSCDAFGAFICDRCHAEMTRADGTAAGSVGIRSAFLYEAAARDAVLALKFRGLSAIAPLMARSMAEVLSDWCPPTTCIIPVPVSGQRRRLRGYNQSELLAKEVSRLTGIPLNRRALIRRHHTTAQARTRGDARWQNVAGAFRAGKETPTGGVVLIDDVITTGATLNACARVLLDGGAGEVFALTFARED